MIPPFRVLASLACALLCSVASGARAQEIALTFDDLPAHMPLPPGETRIGVISRIIAALSEAGAPPSHGFINAASVEADRESAAVLELWRAAGHPLANHTWSHMRLDSATADEFKREVIRNEATLKRLMGRGGDWRWLRYPYLAEGDTPGKRAEIRRFLSRRGYKAASVTMDFSDWAWNGPYARCRLADDAAGVAELERRYLAAADESLAYHRALSQSLHGGDIPYVLLMHVGAFDAHMLPRLLALYRARGVRFITLEQAQRHPFYGPDTRSETSPAPLRLDTRARASGLTVPPPTWSIEGLDTACATSAAAAGP